MIDKKKRGKKVVGSVFKFLILPLLGLVVFNWKIMLGILGFFILMKLFNIKRRGYFAKDMKGEQLSSKQFFKRWKSGIEGITPLQQAKTNLMGTWITMSGILSGVLVNALVRMENQWIWIEVILLGSLVLVVMQMISGLQKYWRFKEVDKIQKIANEQIAEAMKITEEEPEEKTIKEELEEGITADRAEEILSDSYLMPKQ